MSSERTNDAPDFDAGRRTADGSVYMGEPTAVPVPHLRREDHESTPRPDRGSDGVLAALDVAQGYLRANAVPETDYPSDPSHALRATVALLERLRETLASCPLVRCEYCDGTGVVPAGSPDHPETCEYCGGCGDTIILPAAALRGQHE